jgi:hypothetical protein
VLALVLLGAGPAAAERFLYLDEDAYRADLAALGFAEIGEGFEDDAAWGGVRTTIVGGEYTAPSITHLGVTWTANNPDSGVTTGNGPARSGSWGFFTLPHGSYLTGTGCTLPGNCGDGWIGSAAFTLYGVGGWIHGTYGAKVELVLDGDYANPVDFGEICDPSGENCVNPALLGVGDAFFGVIDTTGFHEFDFSEIEGTSTDVKLLFADDFTLGFPVVACNDGVDNDGDGLIDFDGAGVGGADPQCLDAPWRNREAVARRCGLGFELAVLLPLIRVARRRRRSA